jgi:hypothetical protein
LAATIALVKPFGLGVDLKLGQNASGQAGSMAAAPKAPPSPAKTGEKQAKRTYSPAIASGKLSPKPRYSSDEFL